LADTDKLFDAVPDALVVVDEHGHIRVVNARAETLFGRTELIGLELEPLLAPLQVEVRCAVVELDGAQVTIHAIRTTDEASRLRRELLPTMAHELRTPLNAIIGFSELIYRGKFGEITAEQHEYLGDVLLSAHKLKVLLDDVLDLARAMPPPASRLETVDLAQLVIEIRDVVRGQAAAKHQRIEVSIDPATTSVVADPVRLKRILYELVASAIHNAPDGTAIPIRIMPASEPEQFRIEVDEMFSATLPRTLARS